MTQVFISYSRKDLAFVKQLAADLQTTGLDVWYDLSGLQGGSRWSREIERAIHDCQYVLVVLSPDSVASVWVEEEILYARNLKRKIVPLYYKPCDIPLGFQALHFIDIQVGNYRRNFNEILRALDDSLILPQHQQIVSPKPLLKKKRPFAYKLVVGIVALVIIIFSCSIGISYFYPELVPLSVAGYIPWVGVPPTPMATATNFPTKTPTVTPTYEFTSITLPAVGQSPAPSISLTHSPTPIGGGYGQIAFASQRTGVPQIYLINVDGSDLHPITNFPDGACQPSWSPDGARLVLTSPCRLNTDTYSESRLYIINADGTEITPLTTAPGGDFDPAWSPDGKRIAFTSLRDGNREIYVLNLEGQQLSRLTNTNLDEDDGQPAWSPDGTKIVFVKGRYGEMQIWTITDTGQNETQVVRSGQELSDYLPVWSPNGEYILFSQRQVNVSSLPWLMQIRYEDRGEQVASRLKLGVTGIENLSYSADGFWMIYEGVDYRDNKDIYYMTSSGAKRTRLTTDPNDDFDPNWRPLQ